MLNNPLVQLGKFGQSLWLDYIQKGFITKGDLKKLIEEDGVRGLTSNPSIFESAIVESRDYDDDIQKMAREGKNPTTIYESLVQMDVQGAADAFEAVYHASGEEEGYVSIEVNPHLAHDTQGTLAEARRLWGAVGRPNVLIKVPATEQGLPAIKQLLEEGINVNVTLLFGLERYRQVIDAYLSGLEARADSKSSLKHVRSVASFFLSRIDAMVDPLLRKAADSGDATAAPARAALGKTGIASAMMAYQVSKEAFESARFKRLADLGARPQRLLWASTSTKDPLMSDVKYVEALIGPGTINTLTLKTLEAYRDHGVPKVRLVDGTAATGLFWAQLPGLGIDLSQLSQRLEEDGLVKFSRAYDTLLAVLEERSRQLQMQRRDEDRSEPGQMAGQ